MQVAAMPGSLISGFVKFCACLQRKEFLLGAESSSSGLALDKWDRNEMSHPRSIVYACQNSLACKSYQKQVLHQDGRVELA